MADDENSVNQKIKETMRRKLKKKYENSIKNWPEDERPREKLFKSGEHAENN